jgi:hypothetical protein
MGVNKGAKPVGRAWYPSGPKLDGSSGRSSGSSYQPPPEPSRPEPPNPDPERWELLQSEQVGEWLVLKLRYAGCTNYEGQKILVFQGVSPLQLLAQRLIDPHFFPPGAGKKKGRVLHSPFARFEPTEAGWRAAIVFCKVMDGQGCPAKGPNP